MYKPIYNKRKALRFKQFQRKGWSLFACLGRVVTIGVLSVATLQTATAASRHTSTDEEPSDTTRTDRELTLDDVEVTASRAPLALGQAARMVTVLTRDEIQAAPVQSINDLLKYAAGVDVRQRGPIGAQTDIGIRGGTQEQITILLNGINICDPQTGHNAFDLPVSKNDIIRIEIIEGPAARVYGTSSLMGAINIVTVESGERQVKRGESLDLNAETGSFGYLNAAARLSLNHSLGAAASLGEGLSASFTRSDGYQRSAAGHLNSDYNGGKVFYQGRYARHDVQLYWHAGMSTKGFGSNTFYSAKFDEQYERTTKLFTALQADMQSGALHLHPSIYWNRSYDRFELIRGSEDVVPFNHHRTDVFGINLNSYFDTPLGRTALGAEFRNEDIVSGNLGEPLDAPDGYYRYGLNRSNLSFHLEHNVITRRFTLSAGFIAVKNTWNRMPFTLYPGVDASYRFGDHWKVYANYNASLRMPSFTELYYSVGGHQADKYLKPEELRAVEGGVKYLSRGVTASASVFHHHCRHMIDWVMDPTEAEPVWRSVNYTRVNTLGFETSVSLQFSTLNTPHSTLHTQHSARLCRFALRRTHPVSISNLTLSYCYMDENKQGEGSIMTQSTLEYLRHKFVAQAQLRLLDLLDMDVKYRLQKRAGSYTDRTGSVHPYTTYGVVDARVAWNGEDISLYLEANNLTNRKYVDYGNVPQPGLWLMVGGRYHLNL